MARVTGEPGTLPSESLAAPVGRNFRPLPARSKRALLYLLSLALDCLALALGYTAATVARDLRWLAAGDLSILVLALPVFVMFLVAREAQSVETLESRTLGVSRALAALGATGIVLVMLLFLFKAEEVSRLGLAITFGATAGFIVLERMVLDWIFRAVMHGSATSRLLIVDGVAAEPGPYTDVVDVGQRGLWPDMRRPEMINVLSHLVANYDRVLVSCIEDHRTAWSTFLRGSDVGGETLVDRELLNGAVAIGQYGDKDTLILSRGPLSLMNRIQKRGFDLALAVPLLVFLGPLMLIVTAAIRLESPGPALFRQTRVGQGNRQFRIFKFRSMRAELNDEAGSRSASRDDERITRVGAFIRRTSIDELPQLLNVIAGHMSLVGPRPHALGSLAGGELFWDVSERYWLRHSLKPGITGLAQIRGFRGATTNRDDLQQRLRCDLEYLSNWSVWTDALILLKTLRVIAHKNAY